MTQPAQPSPPTSLCSSSSPSPTVFSAFLSFAIPLIIIGFIVPGIGSLAQGAGKMLGITVGLAYISSILLVSWH